MKVVHYPLASPNVTSFNVPGVDPASATAQLGPYGDAAMVALNGEVSRQAAFIAYLDNFYLLFWLLVAIIPLAWIARRPTPGGGAMRAAE